MATTETEKSGAPRAPQNPEWRQGDTARARFYRLKDELLDFTTEAVQEFGQKSPEQFSSLAKDLYGPLMRVRTKLDQNPEDEDALREGESLMREISKKVDEYGIPRKTSA